MLWSGRRRKGTAATDMVAVATLAFAIRVYWNLKVQNPLGAVYSDQAGYYNRACDLLDGVTNGDPRMYVLSPWGAHAITAFELWLTGRKSELGIAIFHALATTVPVLCAMALTSRATRSRGWAFVAGVVAALWQPIISHGAFFMSENWYALGLGPGTVFFVRYLEDRKRALLNATLAGSFFALAASVRPQILLTYAIAGALLLGVIVVRPARAAFRRRLKLSHATLFALPLAGVLAFSAWHMHTFAGHWGLVSENGPINRIWAATHISKIEAHWTAADGHRYGAWYNPSPKYPPAPQDIVVIEGHIGDAEVMNRLRIEHEKLETREQKIRRTIWNVKLLSYQAPFPEQDFAADPVKRPVRTWLQRHFRYLVINLVPVALLGIGVLIFRRKSGKRPGFLIGLVLASHGITSIVAAALFLGEGRMRIPYDAFLITAVIALAAYVVAFVRGAVPDRVRT